MHLLGKPDDAAQRDYEVKLEKKMKPSTQTDSNPLLPVQSAGTQLLFYSHFQVLYNLKTMYIEI